MHQGLDDAGDEAVVHEEVLVDVEPGIVTLEVTGTVGGHTVAQREVLGAGRRPNGIGLDEAELIQRALQGGRREKSARDCGASFPVLPSPSLPFPATP